MKHITEANIKEFRLRIMNLRRIEAVLTEDQLLAVIGQILRKEQIKQEELAYFIAKSQALQNNQIVDIIPEALPKQIPQHLPNLNLEELASFVSNVISAHVAQAVAQNQISAPFAQVIIKATQPAKIAAASKNAPHQTVPNVLTSSNQNTETMLNSDVLRTTHQQALEKHGNESQQQKAQLVFNTVKPLIEDIGENSSQLIVTKEELHLAVEILFSSIKLIYAFEFGKGKGIHDINWDPRLLGNKPNHNGRGAGLAVDEETKEIPKILNLEISFNR